MSLRTWLYDSTGTDRSVRLDRELVRSLDDRRLLWVDVTDRTGADIARLVAAFDLPSATGSALGRDADRAQLTRHDSWIHLTVMATQSAESREVLETSSTAIDILAGRDYVITVHDGRIDAFDRFVDEIGDSAHVGALTSPDFLTALVDVVLGGYLEIVERIERRIDALDEVALRARADETFLGRVVALRRAIASLRRALAPHREAFAPLARPDFEIEELGRPWPGLVERVERALDAIENARELLVGSFDIYLGREAQRTNDVMKILTVLSGVLLPSVVLAGIMGMNFKIGFFDEPTNFLVVVGAMVTLAIGILGIARWKRWV